MIDEQYNDEDYDYDYDYDDDDDDEDSSFFRIFHTNLLPLIGKTSKIPFPPP